jgi:molybdopterin-guanine dinucleotide biosynthesis protein A
LAGGKSLRMGEDKSLLTFGKYNSLAEHQQTRLKTYFKNIYISAKTDKFDFDKNLIIDRYKIYSPLVSIISTLSILKKDIFILAVDYPFFSIESIKLMIDSFYTNNNNAITAQDSKNRIHPLCSIIPYNSLVTLRSLYKDDKHKMKNILKTIDAKKVTIDDKELRNINKKDEYLRYKSNLI